MIIENVIDKEKMEQVVKLTIKYNGIKAKKIFAFFSILGLIYILLSFFPIFRNPETPITKLIIKNIVYLIIILFMNLLVYFNIRKNHKNLSRTAEKLFKDYNFVGRKYIFNERSLNLEKDNITNKHILKFDFNNYYKMWILNKTNTVVIQFNKAVSEKTFLVIFDIPLLEFKNYCDQYQINYKNVMK